MKQNRLGALLRSSRVLILGIVRVIVFIGMTLLVRAIAGPNTVSSRGVVDALAAVRTAVLPATAARPPGS
jgi:hypothetical protein